LRPWTLTFLYLATFAALAFAAWRGHGYYALPLVERPHHPLHWELKPGGTFGRLYGIGGMTLMVLMLSYTLRRRLPWLRRAGNLSTWLDFHIWCGITGPLLIVLHSALKVGGLIAISFWSMVAVALSGILGRYLYAQIPRSAAGDELSLEEAKRLDAEMSSRLAREFELPDAEIAALADEPVDRAASRSLLAALFSSATLPLRFRRRFASFRRRHPHVPRRRLRHLERLARERARLHARLGLWRRLHELFHYWHVFHKPFAILMYLFALVHIGVAYATGYARGFG